MQRHHSVEMGNFYTILQQIYSRYYTPNLIRIALVSLKTFWCLFFRTECSRIICYATLIFSILCIRCPLGRGDENAAWFHILCREHVAHVLYSLVRSKGERAVSVNKGRLIVLLSYCALGTVTTVIFCFAMCHI